MTKDELVLAFTDELVGLLLSAFSLEANTGTANSIANMSRRGQFMQETLAKAKSLLERIHVFANQPMTVDQIVAQYMAHYGKLTEQDRKILNAKLKAELTDPKGAK